MRVEQSAGELLRLLPGVLRARDFYLYLEGGQRLTDLWRQGGRAVLGHKAPRVTGELKNAAERGLFTALPHPTERRFIKALEELFPGRIIRLYADESSLCRALEQAGFSGPFHDPAFPQAAAAPDTENPCVSLWRPFLETKGADAIISDFISQRYSGTESNQEITQAGAILIPVLPWPLGPAVLALDKSIMDKNSGASFAPGNLPQGNLIPPVLLAPATRALYDLAAELKTFTVQRPRYPRIEKALKKSLWRRRGIYLTLAPGVSKEEYAALFRRFLEGGFLIPPTPREPIVLPLSMPSGEEAKLAGLIN